MNSSPFEERRSPRMRRQNGSASKRPLRRFREPLGHLFPSENQSNIEVLPTASHISFSIFWMWVY